MFENPRRGRQARNLTTNVPRIVDLKSSSEKIFSENCRWVPLADFHMKATRIIFVVSLRGRNYRFSELLLGHLLNTYMLWQSNLASPADPYVGKQLTISLLLRGFYVT